MQLIVTRIGVESRARSAWEHGCPLLISVDLCAETDVFSLKHTFPRLTRVVSSQAITLE